MSRRSLLNDIILPFHYLASKCKGVSLKNWLDKNGYCKDCNNNGSDSIQSVTGNVVDNTDSLNPIVTAEAFIGSYTTAEIASLTGMTLRQRVFDTDFNEYKYYDGTRWVFESHPKYEVYTALLTQNGTDAPVATVLENTLGGTIVWSYFDVGNYTATLASAFPANKVVSFHSVGAFAGGLFISLERIDNDSLTLITRDITEVQQNAMLSTSSIEIRVYY